jgi:hypothetical protein
MRNADEVESSG